MNILVINCGSSTIKYQLIDVEHGNIVIAKGRCDMVGYPESNMIYNNVRDGYKNNFDAPMPTHKEGMEVLLNTLMDKEHGVISSIDEIYAVGHRVVQGGDKFTESILVDEKVVEDIDALSELAPLHNPGAVMGIKASTKCDNWTILPSFLQRDRPLFTKILQKKVSMLISTTFKRSPSTGKNNIKRGNSCLL